MSINLQVQISDEHLEKYKKCKPATAISEFIWNSLDADSNNIEVKFNRNTLENIESIIITDDGHGILYEELPETFGKFGSTLKKLRIKSPHGRYYHGKQGNGRYKGFSLGETVIWRSTYKDPSNNKKYSFQINGQDSDLKNYIITDKIDSIERTGTTVEIKGFNENELAINTDSIYDELETIFAPYLLAYPGIKLIIDDKMLDPKNSIEKMDNYDIEIPATKDFDAIKAILKIIIWKRGKNKNKYLCSSKGVAFVEEPSGIRTTMISHTVYVLSDFLENLWENNTIEAREMFPNYRKLTTRVEEILRNYYREVLASSAEETIKELKDEGVYPFNNQVTNAVEKVERQVFDICAANVSLYLPGFRSSKKDSKKFTLELLKEAIANNPSSMKKILTEVLNLPKEQVDELASILEKTTLNNIISTTRMITDRLLFINGIEQILFSPFYEKHLKERSQLQKILLQELWIFGEQYNYGCDDISLKNVLKEHIKLLGRDDLIDEVNDEDLKNLNDIPDICLYRQYTTGKEDSYENLVIELKRPSVKLGAKEITQIENYAYQIMDNKYFDKDKTEWTFILVGNEYDNFAEMRCSQPDRAHGLIQIGDHYKIWVKKWNQIIQDAKGRHQFLKKKLEFSISDNEEGMKYLRNNYDKFLPKEK